MFGTSLELVKQIVNLEKENARLQVKIDRLQEDLNQENAYRKKNHELDIEKAKMELRKEMQKKLVESDLLRVEAVAKLETYEKMDTKDDRKHMGQMLDKAITSLGQKPMVVK